MRSASVEGLGGAVSSRGFMLVTVRSPPPQASSGEEPVSDPLRVALGSQMHSLSSEIEPAGDRPDRTGRIPSGDGRSEVPRADVVRSRSRTCRARIRPVSATAKQAQGSPRFLSGVLHSRFQRPGRCSATRSKAPRLPPGWRSGAPTQSVVITPTHCVVPRTIELGYCDHRNSGR